MIKDNCVISPLKQKNNTKSGKKLKTNRKA